MATLPGTLLDDYQARLAEPSPREGGGNDMKDEMPYLLHRAESYRGVRVLEIGVRTGRSTSAFLAAAARVGGHVWSVDVAEAMVPSWWRWCGYWTFKQARSLDVVPELEGWPSSYDVLFLDGDHTQAAVLAELRKFVPCVAKGGAVFCHDTRLPDASRPGDPPEVARALNLFCAETGLEWAERGGQFGLGVIEAPNG